MRSIILVAHNLRSTHNVGALLRTADGLAVDCVFLTGYTPYPKQLGDKRLPHIVNKLDRQIHKTALGAERTQRWQHFQNDQWLLLALKIIGYELVALEQAPTAVSLTGYKPPAKVAIIVGNEVTGLGADVLQRVDVTAQIPMLGQKESFNVVQAAAMALFYLRHL